MLANLSEKDIEQLCDALPLISVLIGAADGEMDENEVKWAEKIARIRTFDEPKSLNDYYEKAGMNLTDKIQDLLTSLPDATEARNEEISKRLSALNPILGKMENIAGHKLYIDFKSFAKHVAKSSGGFLGFASISSEEKALIDLPMLDPIELDLDAMDETLAPQE